jgi:hypothetical protein
MEGITASHVWNVTSRASWPMLLSLWHYRCPLCVDADVDADVDVDGQHIAISALWTLTTAVPWDATCE